MREHEVPKSPCLKCGKPIDAALPTASRELPRPGDLSVCVYCGELHRFDESLLLRRMHPVDEAMLDADNHRRIAFIRRYIRQHVKKN